MVTMPSAIVFGCHGNQTRFFRSARNLPIISNYEFRSEAKGSILVNINKKQETFSLLRGDRGSWLTFYTPALQAKTFI